MSLYDADGLSLILFGHVETREIERSWMRKKGRDLTQYYGKKTPTPTENTNNETHDNIKTRLQIIAHVTACKGKYVWIEKSQKKTFSAWLHGRWNDWIHIHKLSYLSVLTPNSVTSDWTRCMLLFLIRFHFWWKKHKKASGTEYLFRAEFIKNVHGIYFAMVYSIESWEIQL